MTTTTIIKAAGYQPERSVHTRAMRILAEGLKQRLGKAADFQFEPAITAKGKGASDLLPMTASGELDLCYFAASYLAGRVPALGLFDLPFEVDTREKVWAKLDGGLGAKIANEVAKATEYKVLAYWDNGFAHLTSRVGPIRKPGDCAGQKLRTMDSAVHQRIFAGLGFQPMFLDVAKLPAAVADGTVDAQTNSLTNVVNFSLHKTHRYVSLTAHFHGIVLLMANRKAYDSWPAPVRHALLEAVQEATAAQRRFAAEEDSQCIAAFEADGVTVVPTAEIDRAGMRAAVAAIVEKDTALIDPALLAAWRG
jgi:TRAP-type C4-dicarboxylate transport system substrate-binding protein